MEVWLTKPTALEVQSLLGSWEESLAWPAQWFLCPVLTHILCELCFLTDTRPAAAEPGGSLSHRALPYEML